jgi:signal transduction histidine kinase
LPSSTLSTRSRPVRVLGGLVTLLAVLPLVAWSTGSRSLAAGTLGVNVNAAVCLLVLSAAQFSPRRNGAFLAAGLVAAVASASLLEPVLGVSLGIDGVLFHEQLASTGAMSVETSVCLLAVALAQIALRAGHRVVGQVLLAGGLVVTMLALLAGVYGVAQVTLRGDHLPMSAGTAVALLVMEIVVLLSIPEGVLTWILYGQDAGALAQRRLLPFVILVLPTLGALRLASAHAHWYDERVGVAVNITIATAFLSGITVWVGHELRRVDLARAAASQDLKRLNADLEDRVRARSDELHQERTRLAILRDRNRIGRDLHDRVIQRVFAAGLHLTEIPVATTAGSAGIEDVVDELNECIRELRETIFKLELGADPDTGRALSMTTQRLGAILGFAPELSIDGDPARMGPLLADHLLAVVHEALINVAKHAEASRALVRLTISDSAATLAVIDNGRGMPQPLLRDSGLANIRSRADEVQGGAHWDAVSPSGTRLMFRAPLAASHA